jgi:hypothetical protein
VFGTSVSVSTEYWFGVVNPLHNLEQTLSAEEVSPMPPIPVKSKQVQEFISTAFDVAKLTWRLLRATKQIEFSLATREPITGKVKHTITHTVNLTDDEHNHLNNGGKLILIHACGWQPHIKLS